MALSQYKDYEVEEMSMIEIAVEILTEERQSYDFQDLVLKIADVKGMTRQEVEQRIAQFYTDMNLDGRFVSLGDNHWGLSRWYPYDSDEDDLNATVKPKRKKKKRALYDDYEEGFDDEAEEDVESFDDDDDDILEEDEDLAFDDDDDEEEVDEELIEEDEYDLDDLDEDE
ncbi:DNA-directed RNA polymerase subunit delta [Bacillus marinisedimentorum]|uniref:DNA-directed RNA polymerase subunit delta n=1 Tax=Bacillus marinisedimentorum TaxID=1821260 RepID=UPI0007E09A65|nr:DNA-directed RNA polymerase subunit delta [Bacillus marinisedimentorum]